MEFRSLIGSFSFSGFARPLPSLVAADAGLSRGPLVGRRLFFCSGVRGFAPFYFLVLVALPCCCVLLCVCARGQPPHCPCLVFACCCEHVLYRCDGASSDAEILPESEILAKLFADMGEKRGENLAKNLSPDTPTPTNKVRTFFSPPKQVCGSNTADQVELDKTSRSTDTRKTKHSDKHPDK